MTLLGNFGMTHGILNDLGMTHGIFNLEILDDLDVLEMVSMTLE